MGPVLEKELKEESTARGLFSIRTNGAAGKVFGALHRYCLKEVSAMVSHPLPIATLHPGGNRKPKRVEQPLVPQTAEDIFTKALLELPCEYKHRNPMEWAFSLVVHVAVIAALIIVPLYFTQAIDLKAFQTNWLVAPAPPGPPPPPPVATVRVMKSVARLIQGGKMMAPSVIPKKIAIIKEEALPPDTSDGVVGGVPGGIPGGQVGGVLAGIIGSTGNSASTIAAPPPPVKRILRVGGDLKPPRRYFTR